MLQRALECEVLAVRAEYADRADQRGRKQVVQNGYFPARSFGNYRTRILFYCRRLDLRPQLPC